MRKSVIKHCLSLAHKDLFSPNDLKHLEYYCWRLDLISNWEWHVKKSTQCRFLYWIRALNPLVFKMVLADQHRLNQLNYFLLALNDPLEILKNIRHLEYSQIALDNYKKEIYQAFGKHFLEPVCKGIEEELRVQIH